MNNYITPGEDTKVAFCQYTYQKKKKKNIQLLFSWFKVHQSLDSHDGMGCEHICKEIMSLLFCWVYSYSRDFHFLDKPCPHRSLSHTVFTSDLDLEKQEKQKNKRNMKTKTDDVTAHLNMKLNGFAAVFFFCFLHISKFPLIIICGGGIQ